MPAPSAAPQLPPTARGDGRPHCAVVRRWGRWASLAATVTHWECVGVVRQGVALSVSLGAGGYGRCICGTRRDHHHRGRAGLSHQLPRTDGLRHRWGARHLRGYTQWPEGQRNNSGYDFSFLNHEVGAPDADSCGTCAELFPIAN
eukprot:COSAG01_NODE_5752_length_4057_cov_44.033098_1_plen_145_part_00